MESAGKRQTQRPDFFGQDIILPIRVPTMTSTTTSVTTSTTSAPSVEVTVSPSISTITASSFSNTMPDPSIQQMFAQMMNAITTSTAKSEEAVRKIDELHQHTSNQLTEFRQQWQETDVRLSKLEDDNVRHNTQLTQQKTNNTQVFKRLDELESEVVSIRSDLARLAIRPSVSSAGDISQMFVSSCPSSTVIPTTTSLPINTIPTAPINTSGLINVPTSISSFDPSKSSFFGTHERLQDTVSEFAGSTCQVHPEKFLEQLNVYFENVPMSSTQQLLCAQRRLVDDARVWYETLIPAPINYIEFQSFFRQRFWSSATQRKVRNDVFRPYQYTQNEGWTTHAMRWIASAKYLSPPIEQDDLVSTIIQHYPTPLGMAIRGRGPRNTNELLNVLTEFEESASFCETRSNGYQPRNSVPVRTNGDRQNNHHQYNRQSRGNNRFRPTTPNANATSQPVSQLDVSGNENGPLL